MKINNCKLCEIYDNQKHSGDKGAQSQYCRHTSAAAAAFLSPNHIRDFLAFHLLRGYYQPAGPLISPHLLPPQPIPQPLESDQTPSSQSSASTTDNVDPDVMITGGDLAPRPSYRYGPHPPPPDYSRPMHQMHYPPTYPPSPYGYYGQPPPPPHQEICYSPYYPPKYYPPNAPYARRFMTPNYYQPPPLDYRPPPQAVPQNAPSQIAPAAPTPQHIDHYSSSPYYAGYSPNNGGQCYSQTQPRTMQPPYLDAAQYHSSSCPCPMQSCPKNAHTGTGPTNKAKGPVSANTTIAESNPKTISTFNIASCKIENITSPNVVIKPENNDKMEASPSQSHELFSQHLNLKILESPELTPSPARGSIGLQIPPTVQHEAVQPTEHSSDINSFSQRKHPRVGKSMERERQHQQHITMGGTMTYQTTLENSDNVALELTQFKKEFTVKKEGDVKKEKDCDMIDRGYRSINPIDNVKLERPEAEHDSLSTQMAPKQTTNNFVTDTITVNLINESGDECVDYSMKRKLDETSNDDVIELSDNSTVDPPSLTLKRRKLLEKPVSTPKKSPPNSYKSLIKQANPSTTTYQSSTSKSKLLTSNINRLSNKSNIKRRTILKSKNVRLLAKAKKRSPKKNVTEDESDKVESVNGDDNAENDSVIDVNKFNNEDISETTEKSDEIAEETSTENDNHEDKSMDGSSEYSGKSNIDLTIDRVAKGYFSESDIFTCLSKQRKTKSQKKFDAKLIKSGINDKKNAKKTKTDVTDVPVKDKTKKKSKVNKEADMQQEAAGDNELRKATKLKKLKVKEIDDGGKNKSKKKPKDGEKEPLSLDDILPSHSTPKRKQKTPKNVESKKEKKEKVVENLTVSALIESDEDDKTVVTVETRDEETSTTLLSSAQTINTTKSQLDETDVANNNNECFEDNNRHKQQESLTLYKTPGYGWTMNKTGKRGKKTKFSNRKKHKFTLLNDIVIPKSTSIPRWSNGWVWGGDPYQALVFLNSDDPPVPRTCYDSMRHEECGDVIRPRDCVLLRAGGKRNELPYVAKVAQLWENPEDGEMMMSLFWYYRPEHTEQGRQENDASDEVFASRHKDHNSVACIEDKCHVLTYNEYCRYRKSLRQLEENLDEQVSFVPKLHFPERRTVPPQTSPELVMFCRRVYDFRGKRLVEDKKKK